MSITEGTQPSPTHPTGTTTTTANFTPESGALLVALVAADGASTAATTASLSDSLGGTWTLLKRVNAFSSVNQIGGTAEVWCRDSPGTSMTVTASGWASNAGNLTVRTLIGAKPAAQQPGATGASTTGASVPPTATLTPTQIGSRIYGACVDYTTNASLVANGNTTSIDQFNDATNGDTWATFKSSGDTASLTSTAYGYNDPGSSEFNVAAVEILAAATTATYPPQSVRSRRGTPFRVARTRLTTPVRAQVNPPYPFVEIVQPRRLRGFPVRRGAHKTPVPPQLNPPYPFRETVQPRRLRGLLPRRGKQTPPPVPGQLAPVDEVDQPRRLRGLLPRRGRTVTPVPPQFNPPFPFAEVAQPRRLRGLLPRRGRQAQPVPAQVVVTPPAYPPQTLRSRVKTYRLFRGRQAQPVPAQVVVTPPAFVPTVVREALRRLVAVRRGHVVVPPSAVPQPPDRQRAKPRLAAIRRPRPAVPAAGPPVAQDQAPRSLIRRIRQWFKLPLRGRPSSVPLSVATPAVVRDLELAVAPPETKWLTDDPGPRWTAAGPEPKWTSTDPDLRARWAAGLPEGNWTAGPPKV